MEARSQRLGQRVAADRGRLRWSTADLAAHAGLSVRTIEYIEAGHRANYSSTTKSKIEAALGWKGESFDRVMTGGSPEYSADPLLARIMDVWPNLSGDQQARVVAHAERLAGR